MHNTIFLEIIISNSLFGKSVYSCHNCLTHTAHLKNGVFPVVYFLKGYHWEIMLIDLISHHLYTPKWSFIYTGKELRSIHAHLCFQNIFFGSLFGLAE